MEGSESADEDARRIVLGPTAEDLVRWEAARARWRWGNQPTRGNSQGSRDALVFASNLTMVCQAESCGALVDYKAARARARKEQRRSYQIGDGCGSAICGRHYRRGKFVDSQLRMCSGVARVAHGHSLMRLMLIQLSSAPPPLKASRDDSKLVRQRCWLGCAHPCERATPSATLV